MQNSELKEVKGDMEEEQIIINLLKSGLAHMDQIARETKLQASKIGSLLSLMEIKGKVKNLELGSYSLAN